MKKQRSEVEEVQRKLALEHAEWTQQDHEREKRIQGKVTDLEIYREALHRLDRVPYPAPMTENLVDLLAKPREVVTERVTDLLPAGGNALLVAQYKAGKTTLALNLAAALADGRPFLGYAVEPPAGRVAFLNYEMTEWQLTEWLRDMEVKHPEQIVPWNLRGRTTPFHDVRFRDELIYSLKEWNVEVLILDPAARAWIGAVDNENDNTQVSQFTSTLDEIKHSAGVKELVLTHHLGREGDHGRGATAIEAWPDANWYLTRDKDGPRSFRAEGRDVNVSSFDLAFDPESRRLTEAGYTRAKQRDDDRALKVVGALVEADQPLAAEDLKRRIGGRRDKQGAAIRRAIDKGWVETKHAGKEKLHMVTDEGRKVALKHAK